MTHQADSTGLIDSVVMLVKTDLSPISSDVDQKGLYPEAFLRKLGELGGFSANIPVTQGGLGLGLATQIDVMTEVGRECGSSAFLVWCQSACALYLSASPNEQVRDGYLAAVAAGKLLAGTGMSNAVKHLAGLEDIYLKAQREGDDYLITGSLPWVSNIGEEHLVVAAAAVEDGGYVMFAFKGNAQGVSLHPCPEFSGLEGTQTLNIRLKNARLTSAKIIAHPAQFKDYLASIRSAFVLGQVGMGFGVILGSLRTIRESNLVSAQLNQYLDEQGEALQQEFERLQARTRQLTQQAEMPLLEVLRVRLAVSELTLRAANSAILHAGAKGYLMRHPAQRRLREAVFVAIVTPALKHLRKDIQALEQAA